MIFYYVKNRLLKIIKQIYIIEEKDNIHEIDYLIDICYINEYLKIILVI